MSESQGSGGFQWSDIILAFVAALVVGVFLAKANVV